MVVFILLLSCSSRGARVVNGEDSEKGVEEEAADGKPHVRSRMLNRLRSARIRTRDDAALRQSSRATGRAVEATTAATLVRLFGLLRGHEITRATASFIVLRLRHAGRSGCSSKNARKTDSGDLKTRALQSIAYVRERSKMGAWLGAAIRLRESSFFSSLESFKRKTV